MRTNRIMGVMLGLALLAVVAAAEDVPFIENFDDRTAGVLHNQHGWQSRMQNDVQVQTAEVFAGTQAGAMETNAIVWNTFDDSTATNVWVDFYARLWHPADDAAPTLTGSVAAAFYLDSDGAIRACSNSAWVALDYAVATGRWYRFSVNLDYNAKRWELHVAQDTPNALAEPVATNLAFRTGSTNTYLHAFRVKN
jgi:hypothetical protein